MEAFQHQNAVIDAALKSNDTRQLERVAFALGGSESVKLEALTVVKLKTVIAARAKAAGLTLGKVNDEQKAILQGEVPDKLVAIFKGLRLKADSVPGEGFDKALNLADLLIADITALADELFPRLFPLSTH